MIYKKRIADEILDTKLKYFGAALIDGPKGCGKTTTAKQKAKSFVEFQDENNRKSLLMLADANPDKLLEGETPRLFDEWQDAPQIWGTVRKSVDDLQKKGLYILTGSSSRFVKTPHTGNGRISTMTMLPMTLYESGESNGSVSLENLFEHPEDFDACTCDLSYDELIHAACRGGWPDSIFGEEGGRTAIARNLYRQICQTDISNVDKVRRNPELTDCILTACARNLCTTSAYKTIYKDVISNRLVSEKTITNYVAALKKLYVIEDIPAWDPGIKAATNIKFAPKHNFIDPSLAVDALKTGPKELETDFGTFGSIFESLCLRDLKAYSSRHDGKIYHYRDRNNLRTDCVLCLNDGKYALIDFRLGQGQADEAAKQLCRMERLIGKSNKASEYPTRLPDLKIVITGTKVGYRRDDGVFVIPIGCLKD
ncbi:MAG: DUF4143 domain-containing protein [Clostridia bacterium]|nr:DUF4143 domain-containing protein [Clostridia bacterium]